MHRRVFLLVWVVLATVAGGARAGEHPTAGKLDAALWTRSQAAAGVRHRAVSGAHRGVAAPMSRIIIRTVDGLPATDLIVAAGGRPGRFFRWLGGQVALVPDAGLEWLALARCQRPEP